MRFLFLAAIVLFVSPASASDTPEQVFARYHRAAMKADVDTMLRLSTEAQQARMKIDQDWREQAKALPHLWPSSYAVIGQAAGATRVVLNLDATGGALFSSAPDKPGKSKLKVTLLQVGGEWRVDKLDFQPASQQNPYEGTARTADPSRGAVPMAAPNAPRAAGAGRAAQPAAR